MIMQGVAVEWDDDKNEVNKRGRRGRFPSGTGEAIMGITRSTVKVGQKPTEEQLKQIGEIAKKPIHYTEDCPESTPEALAEFAAMARARRQRKIKPMVALRVEPETLEKFKSLGNGYTGIMADVLNYVADNPEILYKAQIHGDV